jgi:hypothetical protein
MGYHDKVSKSDTMIVRAAEKRKPSREAEKGETIQEAPSIWPESIYHQSWQRILNVS